MSNKITHIRKPNTYGTVEHITRVKGTTSDNKPFEFAVAEVISYLKRDYKFYVVVGNNKIDVTYQKSSAGNEYIKTKPDHTLKDNLLSLPLF